MPDDNKDKKVGSEPGKPKSKSDSVLPPPLVMSRDRSPDAGKASPGDLEAAAEAAEAIAARLDADTPTSPDSEPPSPDDAPPAPDGEPVVVEAGELDELNPLDGNVSKLERMQQLGKAGWEGSSGARGVGAAALDTTGRIGWSATKLAGRTAVRVLDRTGWGLDKLGDWMLRQSAKINKGKPFFGVPTLVKGIDWLKDKTGFKERLGAQLKKNKEERKKLAKKVYDQMIKDEVKWYKDLSAKEKKAKREDKIKKRFGEEAGAFLIDEFPEEHQNLDREDDEPAAPAAPVAAAA
ncbi:MAG: hypothetical protein HQ488_03050 [Parcubacteria group bacterium]|nr:hypothetical protein [Parcubacteria group bacterium]